METIKRSWVLIFSLVLFTNFGFGFDWQKDLTVLGFYAVVNGKAIHLKSQNYIKGKGTYYFIRKLPKMGGYESYPGIPVSDFDFEDLVTLKTEDFLVLYGDMPSEKKVDIFGYGGQTALIEKRVTVWNPTYEKWSFNAFFSFEPIREIKGQKVFVLRPQKQDITGLFFIVIEERGTIFCTGFYIEK